MSTLGTEWCKRSASLKNAFQLSASRGEKTRLFKKTPHLELRRKNSQTTDRQKKTQICRETQGCGTFLSFLICCSLKFSFNRVWLLFTKDTLYRWRMFIVSADQQKWHFKQEGTNWSSDKLGNWKGEQLTTTHTARCAVFPTFLRLNSTKHRTNKKNFFNNFFPSQ